MSKMNYGPRFGGGGIEVMPGWYGTSVRTPETRWSVSRQSRGGKWVSKKYHTETKASGAARALADATDRVVMLWSPRGVFTRIEPRKRETGYFVVSESWTPHGGKRLHRERGPFDTVEAAEREMAMMAPGSVYPLLVVNAA